jgi:hypothetical protein
MMTKVAVITPFQVNHEDQVYGPGETAEIPAAVAAEWIECGWAQRTIEPTPAVKAPRKAPAKKASTVHRGR